MCVGGKWRRGDAGSPFLESSFMCSRRGENCCLENSKTGLFSPGRLLVNLAKGGRSLQVLGTVSKD